jgi:hypothetical protein
MAPKGFEPTISQANATITTTTPHVCLYLYLYQKTHLLHLSPSPPVTLAQCVVVDKYHRDS